MSRTSFVKTRPISEFSVTAMGSNVWLNGLVFCMNQVVLGSSSIAITLFLFMLRIHWIIFGKVTVFYQF